MDNSDERDYAEEAANQRLLDEHDPVRFEQCPGCPAGVTYDTWDGADGCYTHSTAAYNARNRDATSAGGHRRARLPALHLAVPRRNLRRKWRSLVPPLRTGVSPGAARSGAGSDPRTVSARPAGLSWPGRSQGLAAEPQSAPPTPGVTGRPRRRRTRAKDGTP